MSRFLAERELRQTDAKRACGFGIAYLDDALNGIRPCDLIIVAAITGSGKTELAGTIAIQNALNGKRVFLMALEAEPYEIDRRLKYQYIAKMFFERRSEFPDHLNLNFTDWLFDKYGNALDSLEDLASEKMERDTENLSVYSPTISQFTKHDFALVYEEICASHDLIILDHMHYLASDEREIETEHIRKTMWKLRDLINKNGVPIIAFSHIRKEDRKNNALIPGLEEVHGSGEITKQANHVVAFAPLYQLPKKDNFEETFEAPLGATLCKVLKSRTGHAGAKRYAAMMKFDLDTNSYESNYVPYRINRFNTDLYPMKYQDFERWMGLGREPRA